MSDFVLELHMVVGDWCKLVIGAYILFVLHYVMDVNVFHFNDQIHYYYYSGCLVCYCFDENSSVNTDTVVKKIFEIKGLNKIIEQNGQ